MAHRDRFAEDRAKHEAVVRPLIGGGLLEPISDREDDAWLWVDCELCSFVENRFHEQIHPRELTPALRGAWAGRALTHDEVLRDPRGSDFVAAFWIVEGGARAGTVGLSKATIGHHYLPVFSLYVFPGFRGDGLAYRAMRAVYEAAVPAGFAGIRVSTYWPWQAAVRRYLFRYGMWAASFKRSLDFVWERESPPHAIAIDGDTARFAIDQGGERIELLAATRDGDRLIWHELPAMASHDLDDMVQFRARGTFAVALAVHGWPLVGDGDDLDESSLHDAGGPAVLACKIALFEYLDRRHGFDVRAPRIPGLPYDAIVRRMVDDGPAG